MKRILLAATAALVLAAPARAETTNEEAAGMVIGMTGYVDDHCSTIKSDNRAVRKSSADLGVHGAEDLVTGPAIRAGRLTRHRYEDRPVNEVCAVLWTEYGPNGSVVPDMLQRR